MKSLVLFRKVCNMVYCCGLDIPRWKTRERIKQLCEAGNNGIGENREDRFVVCELDVDWQEHSTVRNLLAKPITMAMRLLIRT